MGTYSFKVDVLVWTPHSEADVEDRIKSVLESFVSQKFNSVTIIGVKKI